MSKNKKSKALNQEAPFLLVFIFAIFLFLGNLVIFEYIIKSDSGFVLGVSDRPANRGSDKVNPASAKKLDTVIPKNTKSQAHVQKVRGVVENLGEIAILEEQMGNDEVSTEISNVVEEIEGVAVDNVETIEEIEERPAWKTFLIGSDYKNLGQLRSNLVRTDNQIRKITMTMNRVEGANSDEALQEQLGELNQERNRMMNIIREEEQSFSLLGWVFRLLTGYELTDAQVETDPIEIEPVEIDNSQLD
ncbi:hypothetical protein K0B04_00645 [Patescibacteria group bacterium]|nr:hypothetical protein [Patescibacteria group bacterium]